MESRKQYFIDYLKKLGLYSIETEAVFDIYFDELWKANQSINLFSRKMERGEIWTKHFMDSVSIFEVYRNFAGKAILDFGTGGGLPGVPIQILAPECKMIFLDATKKKIEVLKKMVVEIKKLGEPVSAHKSSKEDFIAHRLEAREMEAYKGFFDIVICRSVKITAKLQNAIFRVLKKTGKVFLYKAVSLEDVDGFKDVKIHTLDLKFLGERRIIEINYV